MASTAAFDTGLLYGLGARVVVDHCQVARTLVYQPVYEFVGNTGGAEVADQHRGAILDIHAAALQRGALKLN